MAKKTIKIGYLPIIDHLILGISEARDTFKNFYLETVAFRSWSDLAESLRSGHVDAAFIMAPYAMVLRNKGLKIKTLLLGHREGLGLVVDQEVNSLPDLEKGVVGIPHEFSTHHVLLHKYLTEEGLSWKNIKVKTVAPPDFVSELEQKKIIGYFGSEPFGAQAEYSAVGKLQIMSKEIEHHHIDCVLVVKEKILKEAAAVQELVDSLVNSGNFMQEHSVEASRIGSDFLGQPKEVIRCVLDEHKKRVSSWDLLPLEKEFSDMYDSMVDMKLVSKAFAVSSFVDSSFAKKSYEKLMLETGKKERARVIRRKALLPAGVFLGFLFLWQLLVQLGLFSSVIFPSPYAVALGGFELVKNGVLFTHIFASLYRVFFGFFLAALFGIPLGLLLGAYRNSQYAFDPLIQLIRPISPIAWIPLAILWLGVGDKPAIFIIFITAFFPILLSSQAAVKNIDPILIKSAVNFGTKGKDMILKVILPASFPYIMVGIRVSLGISWVIIVAAEMVGMQSGLGFMILDARNFLRTDLIITGMIIIGLIGLLLDRALNFLERLIKKRWGFIEVQGV